ncbi:MAG: hypothetical protein RLZZ324_132 [Candidatus Parcubacteria bacterium]|jgi:NAD-dependent DNA ligase
MGWYISLVKNEVVVPKACVDELFRWQERDGELCWDSSADVVDDAGVLTFNSDHMEHMDYLATHDDIVRILCKHKVSGDICFSSLDGDNAGESWGYRFDGKGGMTPLAGKTEFVEAPPPFRGMTVVVTGTISGMTRMVAEQRIIDGGGNVGRSITGKTTHLVVGKKPGSKLQEAKKRGIVLIEEEWFRNMIGS